MTLKELIYRHPSWAGVRHRLVESYPDARSRIEGYASAFDTLSFLPPRTATMRIVVESVFRPGLDAQPIVKVYGRNGTQRKELEEFRRLQLCTDGEFANAEVAHSLEFTPWEEWLGMEIDAATLAAVAEVAIIAHCLREMTSGGFDQGRIRQRVRQIREIVAEIGGQTEEAQEKGPGSREESGAGDETGGGAHPK